MRRPPMLMCVKVGRDLDRQYDGFNLWIPLFILVPIAFILLLALFLIALPFLLIATIISLDLKLWRWIGFGVKALFRTTHELSGLKLDVEEEGKQKIYIDVH